jgi:homocysteine S-methyltransferase
MPVLILDGGMGTTLEVNGHDVSGPMWGSELVARNPDALASVHARYAEAGADILETAT